MPQLFHSPIALPHISVPSLCQRNHDTIQGEQGSILCLHCLSRLSCDAIRNIQSTVQANHYHKDPAEDSRNRDDAAECSGGGWGFNSKVRLQYSDHQQSSASSARLAGHSSSYYARHSSQTYQDDFDDQQSFSNGAALAGPMTRAVESGRTTGATQSFTKGRSTTTATLDTTLHGILAQGWTILQQLLALELSFASPSTASDVLLDGSSFAHQSQTLPSQFGGDLSQRLVPRRHPSLSDVKKQSTPLLLLANWRDLEPAVKFTIQRHLKAFAVVALRLCSEIHLWRALNTTEGAEPFLETGRRTLEALFTPVGQYLTTYAKVMIKGGHAGLGNGRGGVFSQRQPSYPELQMLQDEFLVELHTQIIDLCTQLMSESVVTRQQPADPVTGSMGDEVLNLIQHHLDPDQRFLLALPKKASCYKLQFFIDFFHRCSMSHTQSNTVSEFHKVFFESHLHQCWASTSAGGKNAPPSLSHERGSQPLSFHDSAGLTLLDLMVFLVNTASSTLRLLHLSRLEGYRNSYRLDRSLQQLFHQALDLLKEEVQYLVGLCSIRPTSGLGNSSNSTQVLLHGVAALASRLSFPASMGSRKASHFTTANLLQSVTDLLLNGPRCFLPEFRPQTAELMALLFEAPATLKQKYFSLEKTLHLIVTRTSSEDRRPAGQLASSPSAPTSAFDLHGFVSGCTPLLLDDDPSVCTPIVSCFKALFTELIRITSTSKKGTDLIDIPEVTAFCYILQTCDFAETLVESLSLLDEKPTTQKRSNAQRLVSPDDQAAGGPFKPPLWTQASQSTAVTQFATQMPNGEPPSASDQGESQRHRGKVMELCELLASALPTCFNRRGVRRILLEKLLIAVRNPESISNRGRGSNPTGGGTSAIVLRHRIGPIFRRGLRLLLTQSTDRLLDTLPPSNRGGAAIVTRVGGEEATPDDFNKALHLAVALEPSLGIPLLLAILRDSPSLCQALQKIHRPTSTSKSFAAVDVVQLQSYLEESIAPLFTAAAAAAGSSVSPPNSTDRWEPNPTSIGGNSSAVNAILSDLVYLLVLLGAQQCHRFVAETLLPWYWQWLVESAASSLQSEGLQTHQSGLNHPILHQRLFRLAHDLLLLSADTEDSAGLVEAKGIEEQRRLGFLQQGALHAVFSLPGVLNASTGTTRNARDDQEKAAAMLCAAQVANLLMLTPLEPEGDDEEEEQGDMNLQGYPCFLRSSWLLSLSRSLLASRSIEDFLFFSLAVSSEQEVLEDEDVDREGSPSAFTDWDEFGDPVTLADEVGPESKRTTFLFAVNIIITLHRANMLNTLALDNLTTTTSEEETRDANEPIPVERWVVQRIVASLQSYQHQSQLRENGMLFWNMVQLIFELGDGGKALTTLSVDSTDPDQPNSAALDDGYDGLGYRSSSFDEAMPEYRQAGRGDLQTWLPLEAIDAICSIGTHLLAEDPSDTILQNLDPLLLRRMAAYPTLIPLVQELLSRKLFAAPTSDAPKRKRSRHLDESDQNGEERKGMTGRSSQDTSLKYSTDSIKLLSDLIRENPRFLGPIFHSMEASFSNYSAGQQKSEQALANTVAMLQQLLVLHRDIPGQVLIKLRRVFVKAFSRTSHLSTETLRSLVDLIQDALQHVELAHLSNGLRQEVNGISYFDPAGDERGTGFDVFYLKLLLPRLLEIIPKIAFLPTGGEERKGSLPSTTSLLVAAFDSDDKKRKVDLGAAILNCLAWFLRRPQCREVAAYCDESVLQTILTFLSGASNLFRLEPVQALARVGSTHRAATVTVGNSVPEATSEPKLRNAYDSAQLKESSRKSLAALVTAALSVLAHMIHVHEDSAEQTSSSNSPPSAITLRLVLQLLPLHQILDFVGPTVPFAVQLAALSFLNQRSILTQYVAPSAGEERACDFFDLMLGIWSRRVPELDPLIFSILEHFLLIWPESKVSDQLYAAAVCSLRPNPAPFTEDVMSQRGPYALAAAVGFLCNRIEELMQLRPEQRSKMSASSGIITAEEQDELCLKFLQQHFPTEPTSELPLCAVWWVGPRIQLLLSKLLEGLPPPQSELERRMIIHLAQIVKSFHWCPSLHLVEDFYLVPVANPLVRCSSQNNDATMDSDPNTDCFETVTLNDGTTILRLLASVRPNYQEATSIKPQEGNRITTHPDRGGNSSTPFVILGATPLPDWFVL